MCIDLIVRHRGHGRAGFAALTIAVTLHLALPGAAGAQGRLQDDAALAQASSVILTGTVAGMDAAWDGATGFIYTYVTIEVGEVAKGWVPETHIVVKQLGGTVGDTELVIYDQPVFRTGEQVLLFLSERPRDRTLATTALWQGKWTVRGDPSSGEQIAVRSPYARDEIVETGRVSAHDEVRPLRPFLSELRSWSGRESRRQRGDRPTLLGERISITSAATAGDGGETSTGFTLLGSGSRWHQADSDTLVAVDVQAAGQPGLPGGGFSEIAASRGLWNDTGSSLTLGTGNSNRASGFSAAQACGDSNTVDGRLAIYFDDPCAEISDSGGTLAIGGFYSSRVDVRLVNGTSFRKITKGFIVMNDSTSARSWLTIPACFEDIVTHELGHAVGLGHSTNSGAIMYPILSSMCLSAITRSLAADDVNGVLFVYPQPLTAPSTPPGLSAAAVSTEQIDLSWTDNTDTETSFRVYEKIQVTGGSWQMAAQVAANSTGYSATGLQSGTGYCYRVVARNGAGSSAYSNIDCAVTGTATAPSAPSGLSASVASSTEISLGWTDNSDNETSFRIYRKIQVPGGRWVFAANVGSGTTGYSDTGLQSAMGYCYRVLALNGVGPSTYSSVACDVTTATPVPDAPSALTATAVSTTRIDLSWSDNSDDETSFRIYRKIQVSGGRWRFAAEVSADSTRLADTNLLPATGYCYRLVAKGAAGYSGYTNISCTITP